MTLLKVHVLFFLQALEPRSFVGRRRRLSPLEFREECRVGMYHASHESCPSFGCIDS